MYSQLISMLSTSSLVLYSFIILFRPLLSKNWLGFLLQFKMLILTASTDFWGTSSPGFRSVRFSHYLIQRRLRTSINNLDPGPLRLLVRIKDTGALRSGQCTLNALPLILVTVTILRHLWNSKEIKYLCISQLRQRGKREWPRSRHFRVLRPSKRPPHGISPSLKSSETISHSRIFYFFIMPLPKTNAFQFKKRRDWIQASRWRPRPSWFLLLLSIIILRGLLALWFLSPHTILIIINDNF